jgi:hypothetical protein
MSIAHEIRRQTLAFMQEMKALGCDCVADAVYIGADKLRELESECPDKWDAAHNTFDGLQVVRTTDAQHLSVTRRRPLASRPSMHELDDLRGAGGTDEYRADPRQPK